MPPIQLRLPRPGEMTEPVYPPHCIIRKMGDTGSFGYQGKIIQIGYRWAEPESESESSPSVNSSTSTKGSSSSGSLPSTPTATNGETSRTLRCSTGSPADRRPV